MSLKESGLTEKQVLNCGTCGACRPLEKYKPGPNGTAFVAICMVLSDAALTGDTICAQNLMGDYSSCPKGLVPTNPETWEEAPKAQPTYAWQNEDR